MHVVISKCTAVTLFSNRQFFRVFFIWTGKWTEFKWKILTDRVIRRARQTRGTNWTHQKHICAVLNLKDLKNTETQRKKLMLLYSAFIQNCQFSALITHTKNLLRTSRFWGVQHSWSPFVMCISTCITKVLDTHAATPYTLWSISPESRPYVRSFYSYNTSVWK
jgi:hypothetical protein